MYQSDNLGVLASHRIDPLEFGVGLYQCEQGVNGLVKDAALCYCFLAHFGSPCDGSHLITYCYRNQLHIRYIETMEAKMRVSA